MANVNFVRSVSPAFNALYSIGEAGSLGNTGFGALTRGTASGGQGPLSPAAQAVQQNYATQYRPPTQVYERSVFGNSFRDATPQDRSQYNQKHLADRRNVGHGQGQVDPGLAAAASNKEGGNESGGK